MKQVVHRPVVAAIFSFLLPGLGQFYNHEIIKALAFILGFIILSYFFSFLGILIMIFAAIESYARAKILKEKGFVSRNLNLSIAILVTIFVGAFLVGFFAGSFIDIVKTG